MGGEKGEGEDQKEESEQQFVAKENQVNPS